MRTSFFRPSTLSYLCLSLPAAALITACGGGSSPTEGTTVVLPSAQVNSSPNTNESSKADPAGEVKSAPAITPTATVPWETFEVPFTAQSIWNSRPIGATLSSTVVPTSWYYPAVGTGPYSSAAFKATLTDGPMTVTGPGGAAIWDPDSEAHVASIKVPHWPAGVIPASGADGHAEIVDTVSGIVHSFWQLKQVNGNWQATQYAWTPLNGRGTGDPAHYFQGSRAAGVSTLGGLIRIAEVNNGDTMYRHALSMSLTYNALSPNPIYKFPATSSDWDAAASNTGTIPMGSLMMLPADFNAQALNMPELRKVAETLKTYGAYVVDRNHGTPFYIYVENGAAFNIHPNGWNNAAAADLEKLRQAIRPMQSATGWLDGNGQAVNPMAPLNLLSMRGLWELNTGKVLGVFDTWRQAVVFPPTTTPIEQVNNNGRAYSNITWATPTAGSLYRLTAQTTGGATVRIAIRNTSNWRAYFDSGDMTNGRTTEFAWPSGGFMVQTIVRSGTLGVESSARADLVAVTATPTVVAAAPK